MIPNDLGFGTVPFLWYEGYESIDPDNWALRDCPCSAHTYERQRRNLVAHVVQRRLFESKRAKQLAEL